MSQSRFLLLLLPLAACTMQTPQKPQTIDQILQSEGTNPAFVPMYLMGPNGTFITNQLMPQPFGDTH